MPRRLKRKKYSAAFKAEAVRQVSESEATMKEFAADLGVSSSTLCRWCQDAGVTQTPVERQPDLGESAEIRRLQKGAAPREAGARLLKKAALYSTGRRNAGLWFICWRLESHCLPRPLVWTFGDLVEVSLGMLGQFGSFGKVLP